MRGLLGRAAERRSQAADGGVGWADPSAIPPNSAFSRQMAGVVINEGTALQIITVMACVRLISGVVGGFPLEQYTYGDNRHPVKMANPAPLVTDPFTEVSCGEGIEMGVVSLMLRGNAYYLVVARDARGVPTVLEPLPWSAVVVTREAGQRVYKVNHVQVPAADIIHLRWLSLPGAAVGLSPVEYAAQGLGITLAAEEYGARFFAQGSTLAGVLQSDDEITEETARRVAKDFANKHGGLAQSHLPLILDGGLKWQSIQVPPEQAQFLATRGFQRIEVASLYGVPPHLLGDVDRSTSWGKGIQDQKMDFLTFTISRYLHRFERAWTAALNVPGRSDTFVRFNVDGLLRANEVDRAQAAMVRRTAGYTTIQEERAREGLPPSDDPVANKLQVPLNSAPLPTPPNPDDAPASGDDNSPT